MIKLLKKLWVDFWVSRGRCPRCFRLFWAFNDLYIEYGYCQNHREEAYYEDGNKVFFKD